MECFVIIVNGFQIFAEKYLDARNRIIHVTYVTYVTYVQKQEVLIFTKLFLIWKYVSKYYGTKQQLMYLTDPL